MAYIRAMSARRSISSSLWSAAARLAPALLAACGRVASAPIPTGPAAVPVPALTEAREVASREPKVVFLGDSLSAGLHLARDEAFPALLGRLLAAAGRPVRIVNAGVSGDTTAGGLSRIDWVLQGKPEVVVVELGANDGLRGQPLASIEQNLAAILERAKQAGARVMLLGMKLPPSYGREYTEGFAAIYPRLAREHGAELVPFLLEGVAGRPELNLEDGLHPNARGHELVAENVLPHLEKVIEGLGRRAAESSPDSPARTETH
jgi:acyl-CoA thioesterase-1